jgi:tetratricopeptide (TPR) repeat protein
MLDRMLRIVIIAAVVLPAAALSQAAAAADAARQAAAPAGRAPEALLAEIDAKYRERDAPGAMERMGAKLEDAEKRWPGDYEVLWRLARHYFWLADAPEIEKNEKSRLGKIAWQYGDRATAADPDRVEGWNFAAAGMGNYALGIGIFSALRQGIEGKFKERLSRAEKIDPGFEGGAIHTAWGRFWYELPWPKYSAKRSRRSLKEALRLNPDNVRARVYLAELHLKEGKADAARPELEKAVANPPGRYDPPEERRWQAVARRLLARR